jgi:hypothetical protein
MRNAFTILLVPALLLLGSMTAFAGDGSLPYKPVTQPLTISKESAPPVQLDNRGSFGYNPVVILPAASRESLPNIKPADPYSIEREKGIGARKHPDSFQDPWHNNGR